MRVESCSCCRAFFRTTANRTAAATALACLVGAGASARADEILLKNGGRVSGVIVERTPSRIVIESGPGRVTLSMSRVEKVVEGRSSLAAWQERASALAANDLDGWVALARWAAARELATQSHESWLRVLALAPNHPEANVALGREHLDGQWLDRDDAYRARGFVPFEGRWITTAEHEAALRERAAESAEARERGEAAARVREAEARASEAESRAREAAQQSTEVETGGIPYGWGAGYGPPLVVDQGRDAERHHGGRDRDHGGPTTAPATPSIPPSSIGPPQEKPPATRQAGGVSAPRTRD
jgi:hypothetical protein